MYGNECISPPSHSTTFPVSHLVAGEENDHEKHEHSVPAPTFRVGPPPCENYDGSVASVGFGAQEGAGDTIHIDYDGEYGGLEAALSLYLPLSVSVSRSLSVAASLCLVSLSLSDFVSISNSLCRSISVSVGVVSVSHRCALNETGL